MKLLIGESPFSFGGEFTREFLSVFCHRLENPLSGVYGFLNLMKMGGGIGEKNTKYLEKTIAGIERIQALLENLKPLTAKKLIHLRMVKFSELFSSIEKKMKRAPEWNLKGIKLNFEIAENLDILMPMDADFITEGFGNLLVFLRSRLKKGEKITIKASRGEATGIVNILVEFPSYVTFHSTNNGVSFELPLFGKVIAEHKGSISWQSGTGTSLNNIEQKHPNGRNKIIIQLPIANNYYEKNS